MNPQDYEPQGCATSATLGAIALLVSLLCLAVGCRTFRASAEGQVPGGSGSVNIEAEGNPPVECEPGSGSDSKPEPKPKFQSKAPEPVEAPAELKHYFSNPP